MKLIQVETYSIDELTGPERERALEWVREGNSFINADLEDVFNMRLDEEKIILNNRRLGYSLRYCQGDGVAFYGVFSDGHEYVKHLIEKGMLTDLTKSYFDVNSHVSKLWFKDGRCIADELSFHIEIENCNHHYHHQNSMHVEVLIESSHFFPNELDRLGCKLVEKDIKEAVTETIRELSRRLEKEGYETIEYQNSEECCIETAEANDYRFLADGRIAPPMWLPEGAEKRKYRVTFQKPYEGNCPGKKDIGSRQGYYAIDARSAHEALEMAKELMREKDCDHEPEVYGYSIQEARYI